MKQETAKKMPKWLLPVIIAAAVLVVAGILLAIFLPGAKQGDNGAVQSKLYWNVDRDANIEEESGMSIRTPGDDGLYAIRFAVDGEQVEYKTADKRLVNAIDMQDLMGLIFDADGLIADIVDPKMVATEVAKEFFVKEHKGNILTVNSSQAMNGMPMQIEITENTGIYNVTDSAEVVGQKETTFEVMDKVTVYANEAGENTHIFIVERFQEAGVYYRLERKYNADLASTTREPDENGVYTIEFAYEGEQVALKCKDKAIVDSIDAGSKIASPQMGLLFDEEGYIIKKIPVTEAIRGKLAFSYFHVTDVQGTTINLESRWSSLSTKGDTGSFELSEDCDDIFLLETNCGGTHVGQRVDGLQVGDHVFVYTDFDNKPLLIYINNRETGYPLFYNASRSYDSTTKETTRKPDENGYYVFRVASEGKEMTVRTKDKAIASKVDMQSRYLVGLKLEGDIIVDACSPVCVTGRSTAGTGRYVTELLGTIVRMASASDMASGANYVINPNCKVYDVSDNYGTKFGAETELRVGDRVQAARNPEGELVAIYVYYRYEEGSVLHFLPSRQYDSKKKETKREPNEEGYYVFEMAAQGKWVELKTKSKAMATFIDKQSSKFVALRTSNGIIKGAYNYLSAIKYGYATMKGAYYTGIDEEGKFTYYTKSNGVRTSKVGHVKADNCIAYNVSTVYINNRGEKSSLQRDDYYWAFGSREDFKVTQVWIRDRVIDSPLYWPVSPQFDSATGETTRVPDGNGYYWIEVIADGKVVKLKTKDKALASKVDDYSYAFALRLKGDEILNVYGATSARGIDGYDYRDTFVKEIKGNKVILMDPRPTSDNYGKDLVLEFTSKSKIYDAWPSSDTFGQATQLRVGDKICSYQDETGKVVYCFIKSRGAYLSNCDACYRQALAAGATEAEAKKQAAGKLWEVYDQNTGDSGLLLSSHKGKHYYLAADQVVTNSRLLRIYGNFTVCLDLNGHAVTKSNTKADGTENASAEVFATDGGDNAVLNIIDSKGTAIITGRANASTTRGSAIRVNKGTCNIYGGTFRRTEEAYNNRLVTLAAGTTLNIYAGTFEGQLYSAQNVSQTVAEEAARKTIYAPSKSTLNIYGGTITGGVDVYEGAALTLAGTTKISGLDLKGTAVADVGNLSSASQIELAVATEKVISKPSGNAAKVAGCFKVEEGLMVGVTGEKCLAVMVDPIPWTENAFTTDFDPAANHTVGYCEACYKQAIAAGMTEAAAQKASMKRWKVYDGTNYEKNQHYYLTEDYTIDAAEKRFMSIVGGTICLNLDGHSVTMNGEANRAAIRAYGDSSTLNVMDAKGTGVLTGNGEHYDGSGSVIESRNGSPTVNIYGGTIQSASAKAAIGVHYEGATPNLNIYGGTVAGINARTGAKLTLAGAPQISGLALGEGVVANIDGLLPTARIALEVATEKVISKPSGNASAVKDCFTPEDDLWMEVTDADELKVVFPPIPAWTDLATVFTTDFDPDANYRWGYCEACFKNTILAGGSFEEAQEASLQRWKAYDGTNYEKNQHYYLTGDYTINVAEKRFMSIVGGTTCLNLNGHSVTMGSKANRAMIRAYGDSSTLNLMDAKGTGVLTGNGEHNDGSGSVIESRNGSPTVNIYGGTIQSASAKAAIGVHYEGATPNLNIYGGTVAGINARTGMNLSLTEAPQISGLALGEGVVANIDGLLPEARIAVEGEAGQIITNASANAATLKDCFTAGPGMYVDVNGENRLVILEVTEPAWSDGAFTTDFDPASNHGYGYCEACYKQALAAGKTEQEAQEASLKIWEVYDKAALGIDDNANLGSSYAGKHYYLDQDVVFDGNRYIGAYGVTICWNLNGHSVNKTSQNGIARVYGSTGKPGTLNIMDAGAGSLIGKGNDDATRGSVIEVRIGTCNLYGVNVRVQQNATPEAITVASGYALNIYDGNIEGGIKVNGTASLTLNGAPVVTGLTLADGVVANIDGLLPQAQIAVEGTAGKVISNVSANAAAVKDCFTAGEGQDVAVNAAGALEIVAEASAFNPETAFTTEFKPAENNGMAYCEACYKQALAAGKTEQEAQEASLKEWTVFTGGEAANNTHYYLTQSFTGDNMYNATRQFMTLADDTVCWNLNGQSITMAETAASGSSTRSVARVTGASTLNIMDAKGNGVLTGFKNVTVGKYGGSVVEVWDSSNLNIYGGTFRRTAEQGTLSAVGFKADWTGTANIYGGDIEGIYRRTVGTVNLIGAPVITRLQMASGATYNIDGLLPAAQIAVMGAVDTIFTVPSDNAATVKGSFTTDTEGLVVDVNDQKQLVIVEVQMPAWDENTFTTGFQPETYNGYAYCEACYKQALAAGKTEQEAKDASLKEWTAIHLTDLAYVADTGVATGFEFADGVHYYLAEDIIALTTAGNNPTALLKIATDGRTACLHLNGKTLRNVAKDDLNVDTEKVNTATNDHVGTIDTGVAITVSKESTLNIMGSGYVSARNNAAKMGTVNVYGSGTINIYGGTYSSNRGGRLAVMARRTAQLNIYGGTFLDPIGLEYGSANAHVVIESGLFQGYAALSANAGSASACTGSSITVKGGTFEADAIAHTNLIDAARGNLKPVIQGGTFTVDPSEYVDTTAYQVALNDSIYTVAQAAAPAQQADETQDPSSEAEKN